MRRCPNQGSLVWRGACRQNSELQPWVRCCLVLAAIVLFQLQGRRDMWDELKRTTWEKGAAWKHCTPPTGLLLSSPGVTSGWWDVVRQRLICWEPVKDRKCCCLVGYLILYSTLQRENLSTTRKFCKDSFFPSPVNFFKGQEQTIIPAFHESQFWETVLWVLPVKPGWIPFVASIILGDCQTA